MTQNLTTLINDLRALGRNVECPVTGAIRVDGVDVTEIAKDPERTIEEAKEDIAEALTEAEPEVELAANEYWIKYELSSDTSESTHDDLVQGRLPDRDTLEEVVEICVAHRIGATLSNAAGFPAGRVKPDGDYSLS